MLLSSLRGSEVCFVVENPGLTDLLKKALYGSLSDTMEAIPLGVYTPM